MQFVFAKKINHFGIHHGKIGPYFINTHFVYGSEVEANQLLKYIDDQLSDKINLPANVYERVKKQYKENKIYHDIVDNLVDLIRKNISVDQIDYISGGERRDWFFSNMVANLLQKPHLTIYKDLTILESDSNFQDTKPVTNLEKKKVLHIADLVTVASSYLRAWIPAIENSNGEMKWSCAVVDRMQGGADKMREKGVEPYSLVQVDKTLFETAKEMGIINEAQREMLNGFFKNPDETMKKFLEEHPNFLEDALKADEKTQKRAKLLIEQDLYGLIK